jgi:alpha-galactosidase
MLALISLPLTTLAIDNGLGLRPPLGWRSYNAFGGSPTQAVMEEMMVAMVDKSRSVDGVPTSLLELGYAHVGLDGGWNRCFAENGTFHWASDGRPVWNEAFPDPKGMVDKAKALGLSPGWYLNNCGCAENNITDAAEVEKVMQGSVRMLAEQGWEGVKFDSCSQYHNLSRWAELINATGKPVLIEQCHQGAYTPGMVQWQGYLRSKDRRDQGSGYSHFRGMFFGMGSATPLPNATFGSCKAHCDALGADGCGGFTFEGTDPAPAPESAIGTCYTKARGAKANRMDMSNIGGGCDIAVQSAGPQTCPYNFYRVSGDISAAWSSVLANLAYTLPFLGEGGLHLPYPQDAVVRSRPGGFAYPDMLECGNLANATEDRSHFGAWAIMSSPLILSFNLSDATRADRVWPIISNRAVLAVNQRWAGSPGHRLTLSDAGWQAWAKPMGGQSYAVFLMNGVGDATRTSLPLQNVSAAFTPQAGAVCAKDLYTGKALAPLGQDLTVTLPAHDSVMYCVWPSDAQGSCSNANTCP